MSSSIDSTTLIAQFAAADRRIVQIVNSMNTVALATDYAPDLAELRTEWNELPRVLRDVLKRQNGYLWTYIKFSDKYPLDTVHWATRIKKLYRKWLDAEHEKRIAVPTRPGLAPSPDLLLHVPSAQSSATSRPQPRPMKALVTPQCSPGPAKRPTFSELDKESEPEEGKYLPIAKVKSWRTIGAEVVPNPADVQPFPRPAVRNASDDDRDFEGEESESSAPAKGKGKASKVQIGVPAGGNQKAVPRPALGKIRRPRSSTPPDSDGDEGEEETASPPPVKVKGHSTKSSGPPPVPLKSSRSVVAVPTRFLHDPPCGECKRREIDCVQNITAGACCACRKAKRKCKWAKSKPRREKMRAAVPRESEDDEDGPDVAVPQAARKKSASGKARIAVVTESEEESDPETGPVHNVPQVSSSRKVRVVDPDSDTEAPPTKRLNKGKQRAADPVEVPVSRPPPRPVSSRTRAETLTTTAWPVVRLPPALPDGQLVGTIEHGFELVLEEIRKKEPAVGWDRMDRLEEKVNELGHMMQGIHELLRMNFEQELEKRVAAIVLGMRASEQAATVPPVPQSHSIQSIPASPLDDLVPLAGSDMPANAAVKSSLPPPPMPVVHTIPDQGVSRAASVPVQSPSLPVPEPPTDSAIVGVVPTSSSVPPPSDDVPSVIPEMTSNAALPEVRPGVTLISATPENSQDLLQPSTQVLLPPAPPPVHISATRSVPPPAMGPPASPSPNPDTLLAVPAAVPDNEQGSPSPRRSPRRLSPSPAPSNGGNTGDKKRKDGPGPASGSQTKKTRC